MNVFIFSSAAVAGIILLIATTRVFIAPVRLLFKLLLNTALGFAGLLLLERLGAYTGFSLGVNLINASVIGILGVPGLALLLMLRWLCAL